MWQRLRVLWVSLLLLLTACGTQPVATGTYTVKAGDTLYSIARRHNVELRELVRLNGIGNDYRIYPGQVLRLSKTTAMPGSLSPGQVIQGTRAVTAPVSNIKWNWPASSSSYAATTRPNGGVGLVINGQAGQDVRAAAAGRVVYTGSGLLGYGQLVIIKHDEVFLSAYGHLQSVLVNEGQWLTAGQSIAAMGNGPDGAPMLYFEIRVNGQPTDPLPLLPGR
ncbi:MAG: peptidoglycan DD-metalloendopeptidase family protein [Steroidobacteraceae bacterium]